ncbi:hypothetical protein FOZ62_022199 [Perkinsus olseni]|uniref:Uncharacterized protein n=1 Tax=Perkinsus olseni TaxID=32597 RepID=A0A7J6R254_PEROL|nr:hypothetical protein FOZ62_022199 [Perkinsus olseni]
MDMRLCILELQWRELHFVDDGPIDGLRFNLDSFTPGHPFPFNRSINSTVGPIKPFLLKRLLQQSLVSNLTAHAMDGIQNDGIMNGNTEMHVTVESQIPRVDFAGLL